MPRESWDLHCRGYLEHPLGGPSSTHLDASTEQLSQDRTENPSLKGLPRETGGLHCGGHIHRASPGRPRQHSSRGKVFVDCETERQTSRVAPSSRSDIGDENGESIELAEGGESREE
jgi:hypothetical protein